MTSRAPLAEMFAAAVAEPPATTVTASETYRRGRRRRRAVRAATASAVVAAVAVTALGVSELRHRPAAVAPVAPSRVLDPLPETPTLCADLADAVQTVAAATLPADIEWTGIRLGEGVTTCAGGGLFWITFVSRGQTHTLGFEGGEQATGEPCDPDRGVTRCEVDGSEKIGQYTSKDDYGVLLGRPGLFFFLGLDDGNDPPLTADQLAAVAKEIARVVYPD